MKKFSFVNSDPFRAELQSDDVNLREVYRDVLRRHRLVDLRLVLQARRVLSLRRELVFCLLDGFKHETF